MSIDGLSIDGCRKTEKGRIYFANKKQWLMHKCIDKYCPVLDELRRRVDVIFVHKCTLTFIFWFGLEHYRKNLERALRGVRNDIK